MKFDSILGTVGNTPVVRINKLGPKGINLFVKNEAFNPLGSVKDRLALGIIEAALRGSPHRRSVHLAETIAGDTSAGHATAAPPSAMKSRRASIGVFLPLLREVRRAPSRRQDCTAGRQDA